LEEALQELNAREANPDMDSMLAGMTRPSGERIITTLLSLVQDPEPHVRRIVLKTLPKIIEEASFEQIAWQRERHPRRAHLLS